MLHILGFAASSLAVSAGYLDAYWIAAWADRQ